MNPYERRIIHAAVSEIEGVTSKSTGEDPYRKVIISSTEKKKDIMIITKAETAEENVTEDQRLILI